MNDIESRHVQFAESNMRRVQSKGAIVRHGRKIDNLDSVQLQPPSTLVLLKLRLQFGMVFQAKIELSVPSRHVLAGQDPQRAHGL